MTQSSQLQMEFIVEKAIFMQNILFYSNNFPLTHARFRIAEMAPTKIVIATTASQTKANVMTANAIWKHGDVVSWADKMFLGKKLWKRRIAPNIKTWRVTSKEWRVTSKNKKIILKNEKNQITKLKNSVDSKFSLTVR